MLKSGSDNVVIRAKKEEQRTHSEWFMRQRRELDTMRHSGGRHDTLFEQACARLDVNIATQRVPFFPCNALAQAKHYMCVCRFAVRQMW
eukprot:6206194-Pleurochrysis_carterae.AAC.2